jgi:hypothetical protein
MQGVTPKIPQTSLELELMGQTQASMGSEWGHSLAYLILFGLKRKKWPWP